MTDTADTIPSLNFLANYFFRMSLLLHSSHGTKIKNILFIQEHDWWEPLSTTLTEVGILCEFIRGLEWVYFSFKNTICSSLVIYSLIYGMCWFEKIDEVNWIVEVAHQFQSSASQQQLRLGTRWLRFTRLSIGIQMNNRNDLSDVRHDCGSVPFCSPTNGDWCKL